MLASIGTVGAPTAARWPRSFVDSFKTELIADRVWRTRSQLELAVVQNVGWSNHDWLHAALGDVPPAEFEQRDASRARSQATDRSRRSRRSPQIASRRLGLRSNAPADAKQTLRDSRPRAGVAGIHLLIRGNQPGLRRSQPGSRAMFAGRAVLARWPTAMHGIEICSHRSALILGSAATMVTVMVDRHPR